MATATALPTGTWNIDPSHSTVGFSVKHLGISTVRGEFGTFEGSISVSDTGVLVTGTADVASVDTKDAGRDEHLRSADFFDAENHPKLTFVSTSVEGSGGELKVAGDLTIHGVTQPVTLDVEITGTETDPWGNARVGLEATGTISRGDFGMKFNQALGSGNMMVSDKVKLQFDVSAVKA